MSNSEQKEGIEKTGTKNPKEPVIPDARLKSAQEAQRIQELRDRLYSRTSAQTQSVRHALPKHEINETMEKPAPTPRPNIIKQVAVDAMSAIIPKQEIPEAPKPTPENTVLYSEAMPVQSKRKMYRKKFALVGVLFFVVAVVVSGFFLFVGKNTISGENISITASGPIAVGGGEEVQFQVSIANQNVVPIQSATLIVEYPDGTQSATEVNKELNVERQSLETIGTGELINIPIKARFFGEENEEKEVKVSIDYRIDGSNATFHKEATPLRFKVSTSPVVMTFDTVKTISSGQEIDVTLTVQSNSPTPLTDILVKVAYPEGFDFTSSVPDTVSGEETWKFATIKPNEKKTITIKGLITGYENDARKFSATAGVANATNKNALASMLANAQTEISIEQPFLDVGVVINGSTNETAVIDGSGVANVEVIYENKLNTTIYNGKVLVELSGNALNEFEVKSASGFYDSSKNTITWDSVDEQSLKEVLPGKKSLLVFSLDPKNGIGRAPEMKLNITVKGQRIYEDRVPQELVGTAMRTVKVESIPTITSVALYDMGPFTNTGPTPPVAEKVTQYTFTLKMETGANDVTGAEVTAVLPQYMSWLDLVTGGDEVAYNSATRMIKWSIGSVEANSAEEVSMQVSFLPSLSQVGTTPTILEAQRFKATDRFTGTVIRAEHSALTTSLYSEANEGLRDGRVRKE